MNVWLWIINNRRKWCGRNMIVDYRNIGFILINLLDKWHLNQMMYTLESKNAAEWKALFKREVTQSLGINGLCEKLDLLTVALVNVHLFWGLTLCWLVVTVVSEGMADSIFRITGQKKWVFKTHYSFRYLLKRLRDIGGRFLRISFFLSLVILLLVFKRNSPSTLLLLSSWSYFPRSQWKSLLSFRRDQNPPLRSTLVKDASQKDFTQDISTVLILCTSLNRSSENHYKSSKVQFVLEQAKRAQKGE